jgi:hypothetical protein
MKCPCWHIMRVYKGGRHRQMYGLRWQKDYQFFFAKSKGGGATMADEFRDLEIEEWGRDVENGQQILVEGLELIDDGMPPTEFPVRLCGATADDLEHAKELVARWDAGRTVLRHRNNILPHPTPPAGPKTTGEESVEGLGWVEPRILDTQGEDFPEPDEEYEFEDGDLFPGETPQDVMPVHLSQSEATATIMQDDADYEQRRRRTIEEVQDAQKQHLASLGASKQHQWDKALAYLRDTWKIAENQPEMWGGMNDRLEAMYSDVVKKSVEKQREKGGAHVGALDMHTGSRDGRVRSVKRIKITGGSKPKSRSSNKKKPPNRKKPPPPT